MKIYTGGNEFHLWRLIIKNLKLDGLTRVVLENLIYINTCHDTILLKIEEKHAPLINTKHIQRIQDAIKQQLNIDALLTVFCYDNDTL